MIKKFLPQIIAFLFLAGFVAYAWTEPPSAPPAGNVDAPVNIGSVSQYKSGALGIGGVLRGYANAIFDGWVGIGTASPGAKLEVAGQVKITDGSQGLNKVLTSDAGGLANWQNVPPSPQGLYGRVELNYNSVACGIQTNGTYPVSCGSLAPGQCVVAGTQIVGASGNIYNCNWYGPSCLAGYQVVDVFPYVFSTNYPNKRISVCYKF